MKQIILFLLAIVLLSSCSNYGKKVNKSNIEVYYKEGISEEQAQQTADLIYDLDTNPETKDNKKSFQLNNDGDTINCKMVVNEDKLEDVPVSSFEIIGSLISDKVFKGKPVNLVLSNNRFKPVKTVTFKKMENAGLEDGYGEKVVSGNVEVFVKDGKSKEDGAVLAAFLNREMSPDDVISFQFIKNNESVNVVRMVTTPEKLADISKATVKLMVDKISDELLSGQPVIFEFTDTQFNTLKTFNFYSEVAPAE